MCSFVLIPSIRALDTRSTSPRRVSGGTPTTGRVLVGGRDVRSIPLNELRADVSVVSQTPFLVSGTIYENIRLGDPGASRAAILQAAQRANAWTFIESLPRGIETEAGEEIRRLLAALARASAGRHLRALWHLSFSHAPAGVAVCTGFVFRKSDALVARHAIEPHVSELRWNVRNLTDGNGRACAEIVTETVMYREPVPCGERVAVLIVGDPAVHVLADHDDMLFVSTVDATTGWILAEQSRPTGTQQAARPEHGERMRFLSEIESYVGCKYALGGTIAAGLDCSGLIWRAALATGAPGTSRHSRDQLRTLAPVRRGCARPGDLVFIRRDACSPLHVGIVGPNGTVIHASSSRGLVIRERLADFCGRATWVDFRTFQPYTVTAGGRA